MNHKMLSLKMSNIVNKENETLGRMKVPHREKTNRNSSYLTTLAYIYKYIQIQQIQIHIQVHIQICKIIKLILAPI